MYNSKNLLRAMTMTYYSALLLQLLTLTANTIATSTQSVTGDTSEGQFNPGGCISDWRGLKKAYLDRQSSADVENSIFDFSSSYVNNYFALVMFYDVGPPPNTSTSGRRKCCQRGSKDCIIHFIYRFRIFRYIHPQLLYSRAGHTFHFSSSKNNVKQLCWASPPLCNNSGSENILHEFSEQVCMYKVQQLLIVHTSRAISLCMYSIYEHGFIDEYTT